MTTRDRTLEERELQRLEDEQRKLERRVAEILEMPRKIALEREEMENTVPPSDSIVELRRIKEREDAIASRRVVRNTQIAINRSLLLIAMLAIASAAIIAWALRVSGGWQVF